MKYQLISFHVYYVTTHCWHIIRCKMSTPATQQQQVGGAYGAGKAGAPFDPLVYIKKPQVILRLVSLVRML